MRKGRTATARQEQRAGKLRCAIYTRKSTEEGLDQEFNSLDAQREACEAYIISQRHEGWLLVPDGYDDGGFSGGTMERPGLKRLLADVASGKVDVVVVYKVDRLTRALSDFAKIVETLDKAEASFVSITQAFNTTTSMGRLTLNVLLSFAQFEREVISERVRDKIAASKAKGMFMGGTVPLGYNVVDRKLVVNEIEAETVRHIFRRYLELRSVRLLMSGLRADGVVTKRQTMRDGSTRGAVPFSRGSLYYFLKNRIYLGDICHHEKVYPGEHEAIVGTELFDGVQSLLAENTADQQTGKRFVHPSLLAGMIRDESDRPMSPRHSVKGAKRYRYYASNMDVPTDQRAEAIRLPAAVLNDSVIRSVRECIDQASRTLEGSCDLSASELAAMRREHQRIEACLGKTVSDRRPMLLSLDLQITVLSDRIDASVCRNKLMKILHPAAPSMSERSRLSFEVPASLRRRGIELKLRLDPPINSPEARDPNLIALIIRAHAAREQLASADYAKPSRARSELTRVARASYLAPAIVAAIFEGRQPPSLSARRIARTGELPICWETQREVFGCT